MAPDKTEEEKHEFFDVSSYSKLLAEQRSRPLSWLSRKKTRILNTLYSFQGGFVAILMVPLMFAGALGMIMVGIFFGPLPFLGVFGGLLFGLSIIVEKKVGRSIVIAEYSLWKRSFAQAAAFGLAVGLIYFLVFVTRLIG